MSQQNTVYPYYKRGFPNVSDGKGYTYNAGDRDLIPELGRSTEEVNGYPLQYSSLENPMVREA